jgi:hypothetical protein
MSDGVDFGIDGGCFFLCSCFLREVKMANDLIQTMEGPEIEPGKASQEISSLEEVWLEVQKGNFVRAAHLAVKGGLPGKLIRQLQCSAVRHFIEVLHNFEGAKKLMVNYTLNDDEICEIIRGVLNGERARAESVTWLNTKGRSVAGTPLTEFLLIRF